MNKIFPVLCILSAVAFSASSAVPSINYWPEGAFSNVNIEKTQSQLIISMDINTASLSVKRNREVWIRPAIVGESDTLWLKPVVVAGRTRYLQHSRFGDIENPAEMIRDKGETYEYSTVVPFQAWMAGGSLSVSGEVDGCCGEGLGRILPDYFASVESQTRELTTDMIDMVYVTPTKEIVKSREVSGEAFIDFPVNQTRIIPDYRRNPKELAAIRATIDAIRGDKDVSITSISFKGYASPEGAYATNERLAKGRTESLMEYVNGLYSFPKSVMHSSWVAEDWEGLEKQLSQLDIDNRDAMLAVVSDDKLLPDEKDARLKSSFPVQYQYLLANVYPSLRHSVYKVEYAVRNFSDVAEIAEIMATAPQKLSLDELFLYAQSLDKNSPEFREVMEVAVRMYPDDPEANLNAATTAVSFGDLDKAVAFLKKAGTSPVATYVEGVIAVQRKDYRKASELLDEAANAGVEEAADLLSNLRQFNLIEK